MTAVDSNVALSRIVRHRFVTALSGRPILGSEPVAGELIFEGDFMGVAET
jgi:hypothetical protein